MNVELKPCRENPKNVAGMVEHGNELSQIRKGEVMFLDKTEPDVVCVTSLKKDQALICCFLCCLLSETVHPIIISKKPLDLMENVAVEKTGTVIKEACELLTVLLKEQYTPKM